MLEFEYFEKFKELGKFLAYDDIVDTINKLKIKYLEEAGIENFRKIEKIIEALDMVSNIATIKGRENLEKC